MFKAQPNFRSSEDVGQVRGSAREVDRLLSELCKLYLERFRALRCGDPRVLQAVSDKIALLRMKLDQL